MRLKFIACKYTVFIQKAQVHSNIFPPKNQTLPVGTPASLILQLLKISRQQPP